MKKILVMFIFILGMLCIGCSNSSDDISSEKGIEFAITDGESYEDIETVEGGYLIPVGKWEVTKLENSDTMNKITLSSNVNGNKDIMYKEAFILDIKEKEKLILMMAGDNMQLYFKEIKD